MVVNIAADPPKQNFSKLFRVSDMKDSGYHPFCDDLCDHRFKLSQANFVPALVKEPVEAAAAVADDAVEFSLPGWVGLKEAEKLGFKDLRGLLERLDVKARRGKMAT